MNSDPEHGLTLDQLVDQQSCSVRTIRSEGSHELVHRLLTLGIYPGVKISLLRRAPLGDPMQLRVGQSLISLRSTDARAIEVVLDPQEDQAL